MDKKPADFLVTYFTEKIWEMIPSIYRHEDGLNDPPGVLRALVEVFAEQAAILRRSHDRLWEDQAIETCDDWSVPYIADLLGTRLVSALNTRGRRIDVAKTIYYRRRNGTVRILEELISDITGWEGKVVEQFRRMGRARHGLDPLSGFLSGVHTHTLPGGWADIHSPRSGELTGGPFDEFYHTPDMRQHKGENGRYNLTKVAFHLYRLPVFKVKGSTPFRIKKSIGGTVKELFTFDPSGREIPLFTPRDRPDNWDDWKVPDEWQIPAKLQCNALKYLLDSDQGDNIIQNILRIRYRKNSFSVWKEIGRDKMVAASLNNLNISAPGKDVAVDAKKGRFMFLNFKPGEVKVNYCYGFSASIGAGPYARHYVESIDPDREIRGGGAIPSILLPDEGTAQINDSFTYTYIGNKANIKNLRLQAANFERPCLLLSSDWILNSGTHYENSILTLDGIWLSTTNTSKIMIEGDYKKVILCNCTIDPGDNQTVFDDGSVIKPLEITIKGHVELLKIVKSIIGHVRVEAGGILNRIEVCESIFQSEIYELRETEAEFRRVTVMGKLNTHTLNASDSLFVDRVQVTNIQAGCFRFSSAPYDSRVPRKYETYELSLSDNFFVSRRSGQPGYAQLRESAPEELKRGGENGGEIGAFNSLINSIKSDGLKAKIEEYLPFGLIPVLINET